MDLAKYSASLPLVLGSKVFVVRMAHVAWRRVAGRNADRESSRMSSLPGAFQN